MRSVEQCRQSTRIENLFFGKYLGQQANILTDIVGKTSRFSCCYEKWVFKPLVSFNFLFLSITA